MEIKNLKQIHYNKIICFKLFKIKYLSILILYELNRNENYKFEGEKCSTSKFKS